MADRLPGAAGAVALAELAGDQVEILFRLTAAFLQNAVKIVAVLAHDGECGHRLDGAEQQGQLRGGQVQAEGIESFFAIAPVGHKVGLPQQGELGGDARLRHAEDFLELGDREFLAHQEGEEAQARGVGEGFEDVPGSVQRRARLRIPRRKAKA